MPKHSKTEVEAPKEEEEFSYTCEKVEHVDHLCV